MTSKTDDWGVGLRSDRYLVWTPFAWSSVTVVEGRRHAAAGPTALYTDSDGVRAEDASGHRGFSDLRTGLLPVITCSDCGEATWHQEDCPQLHRKVRKFRIAFILVLLAMVIGTWLISGFQTAASHVLQLVVIALACGPTGFVARRRAARRHTPVD